MYVRCDESCCIPGLTMSTAWRGTSLRECPGIIKTMHTGFSAYTYCIMPTPRCWHGRNRTLWFGVEKICVVFECSPLNKLWIIKGIVISFMFMDICNPSENSCFSKIFPVLLRNNDFSWFQLSVGRFYKMRVSWEFNIYNLFKSLLLTHCYRFLTRCEYYLWLDSKYNVRRCFALFSSE